MVTWMLTGNRANSYSDGCYSVFQTRVRAPPGASALVSKSAVLSEIYCVEPIVEPRARGVGRVRIVVNTCEV